MSNRGLGPDRVERRVHRRTLTRRLGSAKELIRFVLIVRPTTQLDVPGRRRAARGVRRHVVKLEKAALGAATLRTHKGTSALVSGPDVSADRRRDMA
jgi:hypothetical protein